MSKKRLHNTTRSTKNPHAVTGERKKLATGHQTRKGTLVMRDRRERKQGARRKNWSADD